MLMLRNKKENTSQGNLGIWLIRLSYIAPIISGSLNLSLLDEVSRSVPYPHLFYEIYS